MLWLGHKSRSAAPANPPPAPESRCATPAHRLQESAVDGNSKSLGHQTDTLSQTRDALLGCSRLPTAAARLEGKRTDQTKADSGQTRGQAASRLCPPPLAAGPVTHRAKPRIDQHQARQRPAQVATRPATASSIPDATHPTPRYCTAPLPCPTAPPPVTSVLARRFPPRQIPPGGHHREAGESLGIRAGSTQRTWKLWTGSSIRQAEGKQKNTNGYAQAGRKA